MPIYRGDTVNISDVATRWEGPVAADGYSIEYQDAGLHHASDGGEVPPRFAGVTPVGDNGWSVTTYPPSDVIAPAISFVIPANLPITEGFVTYEPTLPGASTTVFWERWELPHLPYYVGGVPSPTLFYARSMGSFFNVQPHGPTAVITAAWVDDYTVHLDGSGSHSGELDGHIVTYRWQKAWDGFDIGTGATADYTFADSMLDGDYTFLLRVSDGWNYFGIASVTVHFDPAAMPTLLYDPQAGALYEGLVKDGKLLCVRTFKRESMSTSGATVVDTGVSGQHGAFLRDGMVTYVYGSGGNIYLRESKDSGGSYPVSTLIAAGVKPLGSGHFDPSSGTYACLVKDPASGAVSRVLAHYDTMAGTWTAEAPESVTGLPDNPRSAPVAGIGETMFATVDSGSDITLFQSQDMLKSFS